MALKLVDETDSQVAGCQLLSIDALSMSNIVKVWQCLRFLATYDPRQSLSTTADTYEYVTWKEITAHGIRGAYLSMNRHTAGVTKLRREGRSHPPPLLRTSLRQH